MTNDELSEAILALQDRVLRLRALHARSLSMAEKALRRLVDQRRQRELRARGKTVGRAASL